MGQVLEITRIEARFGDEDAFVLDDDAAWNLRIAWTETHLLEQPPTDRADSHFDFTAYAEHRVFARGAVWPTFGQLENEWFSDPRGTLWGILTGSPRKPIGRS